MPFIAYYLKQTGEPTVEKDGTIKTPLAVESQIISSELKDPFLKTFKNVPSEEEFFNFLNSKL
jgi:hypothetical protein